MASVNKVIIVGNLGQDPEIRQTGGGASVGSFSVATSESYSDSSGQKKSNTQWHKIVVWNKLAENCGRYLSKGKSVYIEGRLQTRSWEEQSTGQTRYATEIVAQKVEFLSASKGESKGGGDKASQPQPQQGQQMMGSLDDIPF